MQDAEAGFLRISGEGNATTYEARLATRKILRDKAIAASLPVLLDLCAITSDMSEFELESLIAYVDELQDTFNNKVAIVDSRSGHATICYLVAVSAKRPAMVQAFMEERAARRWLALPGVT
jgi:hypothetical protein